MSLLNQLLGSEELSNIDQRIDGIMSKIDNIYSEPEDTTKSMEDLTGDFLGLVSDSDNDSPNNEFEKLFMDVSVPSQRLARYSTYDEIYNSVPMIKKVIGVYIANILSKNPVNNKTLIYRENTENENNDETKINDSKKLCKQIVNKFEILEKLKKLILPNRLRYGDYFVEVVDINQRAEKLDWNSLNNYQGVVTECENIVEESKRDKDTNNYLSRAADLLFEFHESDPELIGVIDDVDQNPQVEKLNGNKPEHNLRNVLLKYHKPHNIVILETKYGTRIGYLEVEKNQDTAYAPSISSMVQKVTTMGNQTGQSDPEKTTDKLIQHVVSKIIGKQKKKNANSQDVKSLLSSLDPQVFDFIKRMVVEQGFDRKNKRSVNVSPIRVRFISPKNMVHFSNPGSSNYNPFSTSIIDPLIFPGKLYMLAQLSNTITKLSRASLVRKWTIDTGPTKMTGNSLQKLKREIYNTRVTLNDLGSYKSMSKVLSDFRDIFAVSHNGRTPVDFNIQQTGDPNVKTEDLRDLRQELVSLSGVPSAYLGMQDTVQLSEQLAHINQTFAVEISDQQQNDVECINELISKIAVVANVEDDPTKYMNVSLTPPVVLIIQLIESTLNSIGNIAGIFRNLEIPVDPYHLLEQYVPQIDWKKFKEKAEEYEKEQAAKGKDDAGGQGGGGRW